MAEPDGSEPLEEPGGPSRAERELGRLSPSSDAGAADWIVAALRDFDHTVGSLVPPVFDAYARVFHPASRGTGKEAIAVRWADVARANGRVMHPAAEWGSLTGSWAHERSPQPGSWDDSPSTGRLPRGVARQLVATLSTYTDAPTRGHFGIWDGWGTPSLHVFFTLDTPVQRREEIARRRGAAHDAELAAWHALLAPTASFALPDRRMRLLNGALAAIDDFYERPDDPSSLCPRDPPSLWWPADRAWCVATDVDLMTTYVGGGRAAIDALLANDRLEALATTDAQSVTWEADTINPLPAPP